MSNVNSKITKGLLAAIVALASEASAQEFVHHLGATGNTVASTSIALTPLTEGVPAGDTVIVTIAVDPVAGVTVSCSDSKANVYVVDVDRTRGSGTSGVRTVICSSRIASGKSLTTGDTITASFSGASITAKAVSALHANGLISGGRDQIASNGGASSAPSSGLTPTTTQGRELLIGAIGYEGKSGDFSAPGSGYVALTRGTSGNAGSTTAHVTIAPQYRTVAATAQYLADAALGGTREWAAAITTYKYACGDGVIDAGEQCEGGACCTATCAFATAGTECRAAAGACDIADTCAGASATCPADVKSTGVCRAAVDACDVDEVCDGIGDDCPADAFEIAGAPCGDPGDTVCDAPDTCDGAGACAANYEPSTSTCRAAAGDCDIAETCDGTGACPANAVEGAGTACGDPSDTICDDPDTCDGAGACDANHEPSTTTCRPDAGECDIAETCDGTGACPADAFEGAGTACGDSSDTICDDPDTCDGAGGCEANPEPATTTCRAAVGECDMEEACDGAGGCPGDDYRIAGTPCGDPNDGVCDHSDTCDGSGVCEPNHEPSTTMCRAATGECDTEETCDGAGGCPVDAFQSVGTACGDPADAECDDPDTCDGAGACNANLAPATTECRTAAGVCDVAEWCTGSDVDCPPDGKSTSVCRVAAGDCDVADACDGLTDDCSADVQANAGTPCGDAADSVCDDPDTCDGSGVCISNHSAPTTVCRADAGQCDVVETCDGAGACPPDSLEADGTSCDDSDVCSVADSCSAGVCVGDLSGGCGGRFLCDRIKSSGFDALAAVSLVDSLWSGSFDVMKPRHVCTPASVDGQNVGDAVTHLSSYTVRSTKGSPKYVATTGIHVANELGELTLDTIKHGLLVAPSVLGASAPNPFTEVNHYDCYRVKVTRDTPKLPKGIQVTIGDAFTSPAKVFDVKKPRHLCLPVDVNGGGVDATNAYLVCYQVKPMTGQPKHVPQAGLVLTDGFDSQAIETVKEDNLCIPSTVTLP